MSWPGYYSCRKPIVDSDVAKSEKVLLVGPTDTGKKVACEKSGKVPSVVVTGELGGTPPENARLSAW
jgi:hypothetical protein